MSRRSTETDCLGFFMEMMPVRMVCLGFSLLLLPASVPAAPQAAASAFSYHDPRCPFKPGGGLTDRDPNVYVYNQDFAELFAKKDKALRALALPAAWRDRVRNSIRNKGELESAVYRR